EMLTEQEAAASGAADAPVSLPSVEPPPKHQPLTEEAKAAFAAVLQEAWQQQLRHHERYPQYKLPPEPTAADTADAIAFLEGDGEGYKRTRSEGGNMIQEPAMKFAV